MINSSILYKQLKKWVKKPNGCDEWQCHLTFNGDKVFATDSHRLVVIKNYPSAEPHFETPEGSINKDVYIPKLNDYTLQEYIVKDITPKVEKIIPPDSGICKCQYSTIISSIWFDHMKNAFNFIKKASKKSHQTSYSGSCMLNFHDNKLYVIGAGEAYGAKFLLSDNLEEGTPWYCCFNAGYLIDLMDLLIDTKAPATKFSVRLNRIPENSLNRDKPEDERWTALWKFETDDIIAICTSLRISRGKDSAQLDPFMKFFEKESVIPANGAAIEVKE